jgi:hypothetical protein
MLQTTVQSYSNTSLEYPDDTIPNRTFPESASTPFRRLTLLRNQLISRDIKTGTGTPESNSIRASDLRARLEASLDQEVLVFNLCHDSACFSELSRQLDRDSVDFLKEQGALWREKLMTKLTPEYAKLRRGEAVFCWLCHPKMYGGGFVTHLSAVVVAKTANGPETMVFHHESIPIGNGRGGYDDGRTLGYLGIRVLGYDTREWFRRVNGDLLKLKDVPAVKSLLIGGFPSVRLSTVANYEKGKEYANHCLEISEQFWPELYYAPHGSLQDKECTVYYPPPKSKVGKRFRQVNHCYASTADLYSAMSGEPGMMFERYSIERMGDDLRRAGLLPRTTEVAFTELLGDKPGPKSFFLYTSKAGVNPQGPDRFDIEGPLIGKLREHNMTNDEYVSIMRNMRPKL